MTKIPTQRQLVVLRFIAEYHERNGHSPSIRDILFPLGIKTLRGVTVHLDALQHKGLITRGSSARSMVVTPAGREALGLPADAGTELRELRRSLAGYRALRRDYDALGAGPETREDRKQMARDLREARECLFQSLGDVEVKA